MSYNVYDVILSFSKKKKTLTETERQREIGTEIKDLKRVDGGGVKIQIKV